MIIILRIIIRLLNSYIRSHSESYAERKRVEGERREFKQFIINNPFSSSTTDVEKYEKFQSCRQILKVDERKRKRAEVARERRKKSKQKNTIPDLEMGATLLGFLNLSNRTKTFVNA